MSALTNTLAVARYGQLTSASAGSARPCSRLTLEKNALTDIGASVLTLRDHVIAPILADVQIRRRDVPSRLTPIDQDYEHPRTDQDYEHPRTDMATLIRRLGIPLGSAAHSPPQPQF
jgi:hypothetical protein